MNLFWTTSDFKFDEQARPGLPMLVSDEEEAQWLSAPNRFLIYTAVENARTRSAKTLKTFAEALYDYFSFLESNKLSWNPSLKDRDSVHPLYQYRNWSAERPARPLSNSTINLRLAVLKGFYEWAISKNICHQLPWMQIYRKASHATASPYWSQASLNIRDDLVLPQFKQVPEVLSLDQVKELCAACKNFTLRLMTELMLSTGLRNEECRTFPRKYLFDVSRSDRGERLPINLDPNDMKLKGSRPRKIYMSVSLMRRLNRYVELGVGASRAKHFHETYGRNPSPVFLNRHGQALSERMLNVSYRRLWNPQSRGGTGGQVLSFKVHPHLLRHTFATHELYAQALIKDTASALAWVRDRLGHSSLQTTSIYLHCLDQMNVALTNQYQQELDMLFLEDTL